MKPTTGILALSAAVATFAATGQLSASTPADAARARIAEYRELGAAFKSVNDGLRGEPQVALIRISARQVVNASRAQYNWFPAGSGPAPGVRTGAKPEIWTQAAKFRAAQDAFAQQAAALQRAANAGNADAIRTEARKLGATCKGCHDTFRNKLD